MRGAARCGISLMIQSEVRVQAAKPYSNLCLFLLIALSSVFIPFPPIG